MKDILKIGVVGYSGAPFDVTKGRQLLEDGINFFQNKFPSSSIEIVSGLTNIGIPKIAYEIAVEKKFITVGISAKEALKVSCGVFPVDKQIIQGKKFGDESEYFLSYIDCLVRVGGGKQSRHETEEFKKQNENWKEIVFETEIE